MKFRISACLCSVAIAAGALVTIGSGAIAQQRPAGAVPSAKGAAVSASPGAPPILAVNDPANKLHLTVDQQKQEMAIFEDIQNQRQALINDKTLTDQQRQTKFQPIAIAGRAKLMALLTPAQKSALDAEQAQRQKYSQAAKDNLTKAQAVNDQIKASITPAQQKQITAMHNTDDAAFAAIEANKKYTKQEKALKEVAIRKDYQNKVTLLLTTQQKGLIKQLQSYEYEAAALQRLAAEQ